MSVTNPDLHLNIWLIGAFILMLGIGLCLVVGLRGKFADRLAALSMASTLGVLALLLLSQGTDRPSFIDLALSLMLLGLPGTLVYARFVERGL